MVTALVLVLLGGVARAGGFAPIVAGAASTRGVDGWGIEAGAGLARGREVLVVPGCPDAADCVAWRDALLRTGTLRLAAPRVGNVRAGLWGSAGRASVDVDAARTSGGAWTFDAGVQGEGAAWAAWAGVHGMAGDAVRATHARGGGAWMAGDPREGARAWVGAQATLTLDDRVGALDGAVPLALRRALPLDAVAGLRLSTDPLGGPWASRGRIVADVVGTLGGSAELRGALGWTW